MPPVNDTTQAMNEAESGFDNSDIYSNVEESMTFDNLNDDDSDEPISSENDGEDDDEESEEEEEDEDGEKLGSEELKLLNDSDGKEVKEPKKEKELDEEDEEDGEESEEEEAQEEKPEDTKPDGKKLRIKVGDDYHSVDSNATVKVKIDGKNTEVPMQDLINNYSGKVAYDKKFTELGSKNKAAEEKMQQLTVREQRMEALFTPIVQTMKDPLKDPTEALIFLADKLDKTGDLSATIEKRMLEANLERLVELSSMSEAEQEAFFIKKQNERLLKSNEKRRLEESEIDKSNQLRSHVDKIREAYGVTVDQYSEAFDELKSLLKDSSSLTHEHIVDWASQKPHHVAIQEILAPYQDDLDEADYSGIVADFSRSLRDGKLTKEQIQKIVKSEYGLPPVVKKLNNKLNIGKGKTTKAASTKQLDEQDRIESFDDLDD